MGRLEEEKAHDSDVNTATVAKIVIAVITQIIILLPASLNLDVNDPPEEDGAGHL